MHPIRSINVKLRHEAENEPSIQFRAMGESPHSARTLRGDNYAYGEDLERNLRRVCSYGGFKVIAVFVTLAPLAAQERAIDTQRSTIVIHVGKSGLLSAAAHDHTINAPISSGSLQESPMPRIEFTVRAAAMTVKPDPKVDAKTQATIQMDMEEMTLEAKKFPEIAFQSTHIEKIGNGQWKVDGDLSLHGVTKSVSLTVKQSGDSRVTRTVHKQTDFGIKPISVAGGMVKVKDEIQLDFRIFARPL